MAKTLYTNDVQRIYKVVLDMVHLQQNQQDMSSYLGQVQSLKDEFNSIMPCTDNISEQQRDRFFMVLALIGLRPNLDSIRDQILPSSVILTLEYVSARLLHISLNKNNFSRIESSVVTAQSGNQSR